MSAEKVRSYLMEHGVGYETHTHPVAYTTSEVAEAEHIPGRAMAKPVMLIADGQLVMAVVPGDEKVDLEKAKKTLDVRDVRLAEESEFASRFPDCERGAEPPFGALYDVPTLVDDAEATAANAYGLSGFPFAVAIDADGQVVARTSGEVGSEGLEQLAQLAAA